MATKVTFHELLASADDNEAILAIAVRLVEEAFDAKIYATLLCSSQMQAESIDELLWQKPVNRFIPHALEGEGDDKAVPIVLMWKDQLNEGRRIKNRRLVINLTMEILQDFHRIENIHDFVPTETEQKALARTRYATYKNAQCSMAFNKA
ncbi:DNA polymerase III subunit chi [Agaribacter flavus]|uniref:DNA polymerase III subunit chi n=1 Tax=Agaribacter flavus TaxID=1902781 RepID=A0ABV7FUD2_9ALTE